MAKHRECYLCGTKYQFCPTCWDDRNEPAWKFTFHSEDCGKIFKCCVDYNMQLITKEEAQAILNECDLSNQASFRKDVQDTIKVIMAKPARTEFPIKKVKLAEESAT